MAIEEGEEAHRTKDLAKAYLASSERKTSITDCELVLKEKNETSSVRYNPFTCGSPYTTNFFWQVKNGCFDSMIIVVYQYCLSLVD